LFSIWNVFFCFTSSFKNILLSGFDVIHYIIYDIRSICLIVILRLGKYVASYVLVKYKLLASYMRVKYGLLASYMRVKYGLLASYMRVNYGLLASYMRVKYWLLPSYMRVKYRLLASYMRVTVQTEAEKRLMLTVRQHVFAIVNEIGVGRYRLVKLSCFRLHKSPFCSSPWS